MSHSERKNELQAQTVQTNTVTQPTSTYLHLPLSFKMLKWPWDKKLLYLLKQDFISCSHMPALRPIYTQAGWTLAPNRNCKWVAEPTQAGKDLTRTTQMFHICIRNKITNISCVFNVCRNTNKILSWTRAPCHVWLFFFPFNSKVIVQLISKNLVS